MRLALLSDFRKLAVIVKELVDTNKNFEVRSLRITQNLGA
jgi:hypothetical protein